jgi:ubiquitin C-terminal hydrolase
MVAADKIEPKNETSVIIGINGLKNLGNSCYINSAFSCLFQIQPLVDYFINDLHLQEVNVNNPLGTKGAITNAFGPMAK